MKLYVLRHGQTDYNKEGVFQGQSDIELNENGISQAKSVAKILRDIEFDKVYVSPLKRAIQTAKIVTDKEMEIDSRITERSFGKLEGKKSIVNYEKLVEKFHIEKMQHVEARVKSFLNDVLEKHKDNENILIVTHMGVVQSINKILDKNNNFKDFELKNAEYIYYEV